jgi:hypothetical protein
LRAICKKPDLRAEVHADALPGDSARTRPIEIQPPGVFPVDSEFMPMVTSGNMSVATGVDIGIYAQRGGSPAAKPRSFRR